MPRPIFSLKTIPAHILAAGAAAALFAFFPTCSIDLPGLQAGEALYAPAALALLNRHADPDFWAYAHLKVAGWVLPDGKGRARDQLIESLSPPVSVRTRGDQSE